MKTKIFQTILPMQVIGQQTMKSIIILLICFFVAATTQAQIKAKPGETSKSYHLRLQNSMPKFEDVLSEKNILKYEKEQAKLRKEKGRENKKKERFKRKIENIRQSRIVLWRNEFLA